MAPISQGMYEFNKETLVEIRKGMGISQSKMAELLGVPPNTLSRWETGATVPDASSLAAIYSLVKERGITPPPFFSIRSTPLEIKISSETNQPTDSLSFYRSFQNYLNTQIELIGTELSPVIRIEISNTAPRDPEWPKIVFTGVGLSVAPTGEVTQHLLSSTIKTRITRKSEEKASEIPVTPWENDEKRQRYAKIKYRRIDNKEFPDITPDEQQHGEVLLPGQSVIYELDVSSKSLPYFQFRVEGNLSRRHLFHCEETFVMPETITKPLALRALTDFNGIDIHGPLESVINVMPKFDGNTLLAEIQRFSTTLSNSITKIKAMKEEELGKDVWNKHDFLWFRAHLRAAYIYLDKVSITLLHMKEAIGSTMPDKIAVEASAIRALRIDATQLDQETKELMRKYNISEDELKK